LGLDPLLLPELLLPELLPPELRGLYVEFEELFEGEYVLTGLSEDDGL
jgi:hypothetical protein